MEEKRGVGGAHQVKPESGHDEPIRVTDRRRILLDQEEDRTQGYGENDVREDSVSLKPTYVEELEARTQAAERKVAEVQSRFEQLKSQLQRETDETRQRLNRAADERARREKAEFIAGLLPVADNLQRALKAAEEGGSMEALLNGLRGTASGFESALAAAGVEPIPSVGAPFDPEMHEAVDTVEVGPEENGAVTAEYSRGYRIGDRLLRPARVQVGYSRQAGARRAGTGEE